MENNMDALQELLQRTETIQKINALQEQASREIFSWPVLSAKDRLKRGIRKYLLRQAVPPADRYSWPNGLLAGGLSQVQKVMRDNASAETLKKYFDRWLKKELPLYYVDNTVNGMALLDLYETGGEEKYLEAASRIAAFLKEHKKDAQENLPADIDVENGQTDLRIVAGGGEHLEDAHDAPLRGRRRSRHPLEPAPRRQVDAPGAVLDDGQRVVALAVLRQHREDEPIPVHHQRRIAEFGGRNAVAHHDFDRIGKALGDFHFGNIERAQKQVLAQFCGAERKEIAPFAQAGQRAASSAAAAAVDSRSGGVRVRLQSLLPAE